MKINDTVTKGQHIGDLTLYGSTVHLHFGVIHPIPSAGVNKYTHWELYQSNLQKNPESFFTNRSNGIPPPVVGEVTRIDPSSARLGEKTSFTIYGSDFPTDMSAHIQNAFECGDKQWVSSSEFKLSCTHNTEEELFLTAVEKSGGRLLNNGKHPISFQQAEPVIPDLINDLRISKVDSNFSLSWSAASGTVTNYELFKSTSLDRIGIRLYSGSELSYVDKSNLVNGTTYYYRLKACNGSLCSESSVANKEYIESISTTGSKPNLIGLLRVEIITGGIRVAGNIAIGTVDEYRLYRSDAAGVLGGIIRSSSQSIAFDDLTVIDNTTYYYTIEVCNSAGCDTSDQAFKTYSAPAPAPAPVSVSVPMLSGNGIFISSVSPRTAIVKDLTVYTISGTMLPSNVEVSLTGGTRGFGTDNDACNVVRSDDTTIQANCRTIDTGIQRLTVVDGSTNIEITGSPFEIDVLPQSAAPVVVLPPVVTSVTPNRVLAGEVVEFSIKGVNFPEAVLVFVDHTDECTWVSGNSTEIVVSCQMFNPVNGTASGPRVVLGHNTDNDFGEVIDFPGSEFFDNQFDGSPLALNILHPSAITNISPQTATLGEQTIFDLTGQRLFVTAEVRLGSSTECEVLSGTLVTSLSISCIPNELGLQNIFIEEGDRTVAVTSSVSVNVSTPVTVIPNVTE